MPNAPEEHTAAVPDTTPAWQVLLGVVFAAIVALECFGAAAYMISWCVRNPPPNAVVWVFAVLFTVALPAALGAGVTRCAVLIARRDDEGAEQAQLLVAMPGLVLGLLFVARVLESDDPGRWSYFYGGLVLIVFSCLFGWYMHWLEKRL